MSDTVIQEKRWRFQTFAPVFEPPIPYVLYLCYPKFYIYVTLDKRVEKCIEIFNIIFSHFHVGNV